MSSRTDILASIRQNLGAGKSERTRIDTVDKRLKARARGTIPARGQLDKTGQVKLLQDILEGQSASITHLKSIEDAPAAIADYCRAHNIGPALTIGDNGALNGLDWQGANLDVSHGAANANTQNALSTAFCAIAETGTLMLRSGTDNPTTLNFLPDNHMVIIKSDDVFACYEEGWDELRRADNDEMARNVNLISGPSRTGDIEQTILLGAHGPRRLHVLIVD